MAIVKYVLDIKIFDKHKILDYDLVGGEEMKRYTEHEINRLQDNLLLIRKAGGWSAEEFGELIGVTKQTISNLENKKTVMSKTQYIAIRAVLDYEITEQPDNKVLISTVNLCLNSDEISDIDKKKAQAFLEGATKTGLDNAAILGGLIALIGVAAAEALIMPFVAPTFLGEAGSWLTKILKKKK